MWLAGCGLGGFRPQKSPAAASCEILTGVETDPDRARPRTACRTKLSAAEGKAHPLFGRGRGSEDGAVGVVFEGGGDGR